MVYFAYAIAWISTAFATGAGIYFTHSAWWLCAFVFPAIIAITKGGKEETDNKELCDTLNSKEEQCWPSRAYTKRKAEPSIRLISLNLMTGKEKYLMVEWGICERLVINLGMQVKNWIKCREDAEKWYGTTYRGGITKMIGYCFHCNYRTVKAREFWWL